MMDVFLAHCEGPWRRGVNDCYVAIADQVREWTGVDLMRRCRGFSSFTGMLRLIRKAGYANPREAMESRLAASDWAKTSGPYRNRDLTLIAHTEDQKTTVSPAVFYDGFWHIRGRTGWLAFREQETTVEYAWRLSDGD